MLYFADNYSKDRWPSRDYFWTVVNTLRPKLVQELVQHANQLRFRTEETGDHAEDIQMTEDWWNKLNEMPYFSRQKGRTIQLLKEKSKPIPKGRKRRKVELMSFGPVREKGDTDMAPEEEEKKDDQSVSSSQNSASKNPGRRRTPYDPNAV